MAVEKILEGANTDGAAPSLVLDEIVIDDTDSEGVSLTVDTAVRVAKELGMVRGEQEKAKPAIPMERTVALAETLIQGGIDTVQVSTDVYQNINLNKCLPDQKKVPVKRIT